VRDAQSQHRFHINPPLLGKKVDVMATGLRKASAKIEPDVESLRAAGILLSEHKKPVETIEFDIALTVESKQESSLEETGKKGGGLKVYVATAELGSEHKSGESEATASSTVSRIKFRIPISFH
jgi:hypothetical protein